MSDPAKFETIADTTNNSLKDFDIAVSLTIPSINEQLGSAWNKWHHKNDGLNLLEREILKESEDGDSYNDTSYKLALSLGAPTVSLDPVKQSLHEVLVTFPIVRGSLTKAVGSRGAALNMDGRSFSFVAELVRNEVRQEHLYKIDEKTAQTVASMTAMQGAGAFTIECLFLNLTQINIVTGFAISPLDPVEIARRFSHRGYAPKFTDKPENLAALRAELENQFMLAMRDHFARETTPSGEPIGRFLLNTTLRPHEPKVKPSLIVNALRFKTTRGTSTIPDSLDYLGTVVGGRTIPPAGGTLDNALSGLGSWLTPSRVAGSQATAAGMMALRGACVGRLLADALHSALRVQYDQMETKNKEDTKRIGTITKPEIELSYPEFKLLKTDAPTLDEASGKITIVSRDSENSYTWPDTEDGNKVHFTLLKKFCLELSPIAHECYKIGGSYSIELKRRRDTVWGEVDARMNTTVPITGTLTLQANSDGVTCRISPRIAVAYGEARQEGNAQGSNFFVKIFNQVGWDKERLSSFSDSIGKAIVKMLNEVFARLNLQLENFAIIPPGEEAFGFSKPRIGNSGDLFLDVVYRASRRPN